MPSNNSGVSALVPDGDCSGASCAPRHPEESAVVGRLAHDFGNILTSILGFSELAMMQLNANADATPYVAEIQRAAQAGAKFVRDLQLSNQRGPVKVPSSSQDNFKGVHTW